MTFDGSALKFPHFNTSGPVEQARRHVKYLQQAISQNLSIDTRVIPVIALPGWFVERTGHSDVWVINPKRGGALAAEIRKSAISVQQAELIANYVESVARSVPAGSKKMDPDASKYYDFWSKRRREERRIG